MQSFRKERTLEIILPQSAQLSFTWSSAVDKSLRLEDERCLRLRTSDLLSKRGTEAVNEGPCFDGIHALAIYNENRLDILRKPQLYDVMT